MADDVSVTRDGAVTVIRLERAAKKNALTTEMYATIADALAAAHADDVRAVVLLGQPGIFTAGNDLQDFLARPPRGADTPVFRFLRGLIDLPVPLVVGVDGAAIGIGTTLLPHADVVVASSRARFQMPFVSLGLCPEAASSALLPPLVGMATASRWLLLGESFTAEEAHRAGLVNELVAEGAADARAIELAKTIASKPPGAMRASKELLRAPLRPAIHDALAREGKIFLERLTAPETIQAMTAFFAKKV